MGNLKIMSTSEYSKFQRQQGTTAKNIGYTSASVVEEYAALAEEVIANLTDQHSKDTKMQMQRMELW